MALATILADAPQSIRQVFERLGACPYGPDNGVLPHALANAYLGVVSADVTYPRATPSIRSLGKTASKYSLEDLFGAANLVRPDYIRVEADEASWGIRLRVGEVAGVWQEGVKPGRHSAITMAIANTIRKTSTRSSLRSAGFLNFIFGLSAAVYSAIRRISNKRDILCVDAYQHLPPEHLHLRSFCCRGGS